MNYIRLARQFMTPVSIRIVLAIVFIFFIWLYFIPADHLDDYNYATEVLHFLKSNKHEHLKTQLHHLKINNPVQLAKLSISDGAWVKAALQHSSPQALTEVTKISNLMYQHLLLKQWLVTNKIHNYEHKLHSLEINSLEKFHDIEDDIIRVVTVGDSTLTDYKAMLNAVKSLRSTQNMQVLKHNLWSIVAKENWNPKWSYGHLFIFILIGVIVIICTELYSHTTDTVRFYDLLLGNYLAVRTCNVSWHWEDPAEVGNTMEFTTYFHLMNGRKCKLTTRDKVLIEVMTGTSKIPVTLHFPDNGNTSLANASFTVRQAGVYYVSVMVNAEHVMGSPFKKTFKAGNIDAGKSHFIGQSSIVMCTAGTCHPMILETCDQFGNSCDYDPKKHFPDHYVLQINKVGSDVVETPNLEIAYETSSHKLILRLVVNEEGCYNAVALYNGEPIGNGHFTLIVLNDEDTETMRMAVKKKSTWFESRQLGYDPEKPHKSRKVYCFVSPKQFTVKEYYLKYIPRRLYTFRVCPTTKISFSTSDSRCDLPIFTVDDGCQFNITLAAKERNIIGACFSTHLIKNIGGSESFSDKCNYFYNEIRDLHKHRHHSEIILKIQREQLLASSYKATKHFSTSQWCKKFNIQFEGEQGLDYGGVGREWIDLLCTAIFDPLATGMFTSFAESSQGLAHPSKCIPSDFSLKHYEFAGKLVGKCIYESSLGGIYTRLVKARFTRSFLAQLIGLRITYKYFEQDDPQLYISKIKYILENEVEDMDLYFTEEEYKGYQLEAVVNLIPNGNQIQVNDQNKIQYLNALAQYKLSVCSKAAIGAFLKGLNELIPDELLSIFDENELELLICGTGDYSIADFKQNHVTSNMVNAQVLNWFWTVVSGFTQEEMARLLQFATGSSQLPPGGFGQLDPPFRISSTLTFGNLPTAHTCFHQLCLPGYASFDDFRQSLLLAITEGSQGFGLV